MGEGVKDYLKDIGGEVASSLGEELKGVDKDKATAFVKEQFGLEFIACRNVWRRVRARQLLYSHSSIFCVRRQFQRWLKVDSE